MYVTKQNEAAKKASETDAKTDSGVAIEVTPEMTMAGAAVLQSEVFDSVHWQGGHSELRGENVALAVWKAMCAIRRSVQET
jgi:hypothetical protein